MSFQLSILPLLHCLLFPLLQPLLLSFISLCHIHFQPFTCIVPSFWNAFPSILSICLAAKQHSGLNPVSCHWYCFSLQIRSAGIFLHHIFYTLVFLQRFQLYFIIIWFFGWSWCRYDRPPDLLCKLHEGSDCVCFAKCRICHYLW